MWECLCLFSLNQKQRRGSHPHKSNTKDSPCQALQRNQLFKRIASSLIWHFVEFFSRRWMQIKQTPEQLTVHRKLDLTQDNCSLSPLQRPRTEQVHSWPLKRYFAKLYQHCSRAFNCISRSSSVDGDAREEFMHHLGLWEFTMGSSHYFLND